MGEKSGIKIFYNGSIYSKYAPLTVAESIVTKDEKIEFVGSSDEAMKLYGKNAVSIVNLKGKAIGPGFVDSHIHPDDVGGSLNFLNLRGISSIEEMKHRVQDYHLMNPDIRVIIGTGWDQEAFSEGRWPNRWDLDQVENSVPVYLERFCEHAGVINTKMLELLRSNTFPDSIFPRSTAGDLSGVVKEEASGFFKEKALEIAGSLERNLVSAAHYLLSLGITSVGFVFCSPESVEFFAKEGKSLGLRVIAYLREDSMGRVDELREKVGENSFLQINGIKLFADGALGAGTASLNESYSDDPNNKGILYLEERKLKKIFERFEGKRVQFAVHAIGDRGIDAVIRAVELTGRKKLVEPRIEHCTVLREDQISKLAEFEIGVSVQPAFVIDDWWAVKRLGKERSRYSYPLGTLHRRGIKLGISTDSPVSIPDPWFTIDAAVNRGEKEKREILKYSMDEKVDLATALELYTAGSASLLMCDEFGTLEVGKFADFVILDRDPFKTSDLKSVAVLETVVGGVTRYSREN